MNTFKGTGRQADYQMRAYDGNKLLTGSKGKLQKVANGGSCNVALANYFFNELGKNTDTWSNKTASHYWYFPAPSISTMNNWEIRAVQTIPDSGVQNTYSVGRLTNDNGEF